MHLYEDNAFSFVLFFLFILGIAYLLSSYRCSCRTPSVHNELESNPEEATQAASSKKSRKKANMPAKKPRRGSRRD